MASEKSNLKNNLFAQQTNPDHSVINRLSIDQINDLINECLHFSMVIEYLEENGISCMGNDLIFKSKDSMSPRYFQLQIVELKAPHILYIDKMVKGKGFRVPLVFAFETDEKKLDFDAKFVGRHGI